MAAVDQLLEQALALPEEDRQKIATSLLRTLHAVPNDDVVLMNEKWRAAWVQELRLRSQSIEDGSVEALDGDEVMNEMLAFASAPHQ